MLASPAHAAPCAATLPGFTLAPSSGPEITDFTLNPVTAAIVAAVLLGEPIGLNLVVGVVAVFAGIWLASTDRAPGGPPHRREAQPETLLRRLLSAVGLRQYGAPPDYSDRLCRDIGIEPPPKAPEWPLPGNVPRA